MCSASSPRRHHRSTSWPFCAMRAATVVPHDPAPMQATFVMASECHTPPASKITVGAPGIVQPPVDALLRTARRNEERGFDVIWWPDHLMGWHPQSVWTPDVAPLAAALPNPHMYFDPVAAIAAAAAVTSTIQLGVAVTEPVRNHPAQLARAWLTLDHLTAGRAICAIGAGEGENITP